jgi:hypothetical protein
MANFEEEIDALNVVDCLLPWLGMDPVTLPGIAPELVREVWTVTHPEREAATILVKKHQQIGEHK